MKRIVLTALVIFAFGLAQAASSSSGNGAAILPKPLAKRALHAVVMEMPSRVEVGQTPGGATHSVVLTWSASPDAAAYPGLTYNVYRLTGACSSTATFTKINTSPTTALTFTDASVAPGAYCYYVTAALNGIESVPSNQAAAAILVLPPGSVVLSAK